MADVELSVLPAADAQEETEHVRLLSLVQLSNVLVGTHLLRTGSALSGKLVREIESRRNWGAACEQDAVEGREGAEQQREDLRGRRRGARKSDSGFCIRGSRVPCTSGKFSANGERCGGPVRDCRPPWESATSCGTKHESNRVRCQFELELSDLLLRPFAPIRCRDASVLFDSRAARYVPHQGIALAHSRGSAGASRGRAGADKSVLVRCSGLADSHRAHARDPDPEGLNWRQKSLFNKVLPFLSTQSSCGALSRSHSSQR